MYIYILSIKKVSHCQLKYQLSPIDFLSVRFQLAKYSIFSLLTFLYLLNSVLFSISCTLLSIFSRIFYCSSLILQCPPLYLYPCLNYNIIYLTYQCFHFQKVFFFPMYHINLGRLFLHLPFCPNFLAFYKHTCSSVSKF